MVFGACACGRAADIGRAAADDETYYVPGGKISLWVTVTQGKGWKYKGFFAAAYATDPITGEESEVIFWFFSFSLIILWHPPTPTRLTLPTPTPPTLSTPPPHTHAQPRHLISLLLASCGPVPGLPGGTDDGTDGWHHGG